MGRNDLTAYREQHDSIREEFKRQTANWGKNEISPHLQWVVERLGLQPHFEVFEYINSFRSNDPSIGYNRWPKFRGSR